MTQSPSMTTENQVTAGLVGSGDLLGRVLVACEYSGAVRDAFAARGWDAWSCDLLPTDAPGLHYQGDVRHMLDGWTPVRHQCECDPEGDGLCQLTGGDTSECSCIGPTQDDVEYIETEHGLFARPTARPHWDIMIAFPPCTDLCVSGAKHFAAKRADGRQQRSIDFFMMLANAPIQRIAIENPVGIMSTVWRKPDCIIQPYEHGHEATKTTCLWLKNLPPIMPTNIVGRGERHVTKSGKSLPKWYHDALGKPDRWKIRSATFPGIASAMADQWTRATRPNASGQPHPTEHDKTL